MTVPLYGPAVCLVFCLVDIVTATVASSEDCPSWCDKWTYHDQECQGCTAAQPTPAVTPTPAATPIQNRSQLPTPAATMGTEWLVLLLGVSFLLFLLLCCWPRGFLCRVLRSSRAADKDADKDRDVEAAVDTSSSSSKWLDVFQECWLYVAIKESVVIRSLLSSGVCCGQNGQLSKWLDPAWSAISLDQLEELRSKVQQTFKRSYSTVNMYQVNERILQPLCDQYRKSYAHVVNAEEPLHVNVFVSHAWAENFDEFVNSVKAPFDAWTLKPNIWICATALIQSTDPTLVASQVGTSDDPSNAPFTRALVKSDKVLVVRNNAVDLYDRIWCCWEMYTAHIHGFTSKPGAIMVTGPAALSFAKPIDVAAAKASNLEDKRKILSSILDSKGDYQTINDTLTEIRNFGQ